MAKKFPISPKHPERIQHPIETDGPGWYKHGDWSNLLTDEQQIELGLKTAPEPATEAPAQPAKPHIKLPLKQH